MDVQNNGKEIYIKSACAARAKLFFFLLIGPTDFFGCLCCRRRLALHDFLFCLAKSIYYHSYWQFLQELAHKPGLDS